MIVRDEEEAPFDDPIVAEVRAARDKFAKRYDYDLDAIVGALQEASARAGRSLVSFAPHAVENVKKAA